MRRLSTAFIGGLIVGAVAVVGVGYWAGFDALGPHLLHSFF